MDRYVDWHAEISRPTCSPRPPTATKRFSGGSFEVSDEITLRPSKKTQGLMLFVSILFVLAGVFIRSHQTGSSDAWMAYACIGFFGLCALVSVAQLLPGSSFLKIGREGFEFRTLWRGASFRWSDVEEFGVAEFTLHHSGIPQKNRMVGFRFSPSYEKGGKNLALRRLNEGLVGYEAALPDNYGMKHEELAALLNRKKAEYT
ncbi:MAG TPA: STM3941 family protein [Candidatus Binatia bacterium]|jgi:hypothetical protein|nr:STM3941 family protein [Candidatus Binatia bacterium]